VSRLGSGTCDTRSCPTPDKEPGGIEAGRRITIEVTGSGPQASLFEDTEVVPQTLSDG
jgi:hypothetical protein